MLVASAGCGLFGLASEAEAEPVTFTYRNSISSPPATTQQLGSSPWATVVFTDISNGLFSMAIDTTFNSSQSPASDPSITQLAFNILNYGSSDSFQLKGCSPDGATPSTCDGTITLDYGPADSVGVNGSAQNFGYDLLVNLPPPGIKLNNDQAPITLLIQGASDFLVEDFKACSFGIRFENGCKTGFYETVAKVQELKGTPGSTVISGSDPPPPNGNSPAPGPLPLLGAASALGFSRTLRRRLAAHQGSGRM